MSIVKGNHDDIDIHHVALLSFRINAPTNSIQIKA